MKPASADRDRQLSAIEQEQSQLIHKLADAPGPTSAANPWVDIDRVRHAMPPKSVMINFERFGPFSFSAGKWSDWHYIAWVIPASDEGPVKIIDLGEAARIDTAVTDFRKAMDGASSTLDSIGEQAADESLQGTLRPLAEMIWKPLAQHVADKRELILSPAAGLWLVPWAALPLESDKYLLDKYEIRYVVSGRELLQQREPSTGIRRSCPFCRSGFCPRSRSGKKEDSGGERQDHSSLGQPRRYCWASSGHRA